MCLDETGNSRLLVLAVEADGVEAVGTVGTVVEGGTEGVLLLV